MSTNVLTLKSRRCWFRVMSGIERGGELRFLTLTTSDESPDDIQRSWRKLYMRMKRRNLVAGYIKVSELTQAGKPHLHILFRGKYISQRWISNQWEDIHRAPVVDIRRFRIRRNRRQAANYMAKYMSKESAGRYSWSWGWVWRGFCTHWKILKKRVWHAIPDDYQEWKKLLLYMWREILHDKIRPPWDEWATGYLV